MTTLAKSFLRQLLVMKTGESFSGGLLILHRSHGYYLIQNKKVKKEKKINKPPSAFFRYYIENLPSINQDFDDSADDKKAVLTGERMRIAVSMWEDESDCIKQRFQIEYNEALQKYKNMKREMEVDEHEIMEDKAPIRPKRPFMLFYSEIYTELKSQFPVAHDSRKAAGKLWNDLPSDEKEQYTKRYNDAITLFNKNLTPKERILLDQQKKERAHKRQIRLGHQYGAQMLKFKAPPAPPRNSFIIFARENSETLHPPKGVPFFKYCSEVWKDMSEEEKYVYKEKHGNMWKIHNEKMSEFKGKRKAKVPEYHDKEYQEENDGGKEE